MLTYKAKKINTVVWMLGWCMASTLLTVLVKSLTKRMSIYVVILMRSIFALLFLLPVVVKKGVGQPVKGNMPWYVLSSFVSAVDLFCTYYAYQNLRFAVATAIGYTEPMMQVLLSIFLLQTVVAAQDWLLMGMGYIGVLCMVYPISSTGSQWALLVALLANLLAALFKVMTKHITKTEPIHQIMLYKSLMQIPLVAMMAALYWQAPVMTDRVYLLGMGGLAFFGQYCYMHTMKIADFQVIGMMTYLRMVFALFAGFYFFGEIPTVLKLIGSLIIIMANYLLIRSQSKEVG